MPESDITIDINIRRIGYSQITAQPNNTAYGSVTMSPESTGGDGYYREGAYLRINAAAKSGYRFVKWEEAQGSSYLSEEQKLSSSLNLRVGIDSAALTAVFEEDTNPVAQALNLVVDPAGKANVLVNGAKGVTGAFEGESVTVSLGDVDDYYAFDHWEITRDSSGESLITSAASYNESVTFVVPNGSVSVKAVLNQRAIEVTWMYYVKKGENSYVSSSDTTPYMADISIWKNGVYQDPNSKITVVKGDTIGFEVKLKDPNKYILEKIWLVSSGTMVQNYDDYNGEYTVTSWKYKGKNIYQLTINAYFDTTIENGKFTMPACDVTISCQWESTASQPTGGGITGFVIDGIPGTIDVGGNIVVIMPYKTDVTALRPVITGVNIAEMTPASSEAVDFTKPVIYTVTLTDGTVKIYTATVYVQSGTAADQMWGKLTDFHNQVPWWKYAEHQQSYGKYPRYW